jgi:hypothetical protein
MVGTYLSEERPGDDGEGTLSEKGEKTKKKAQQI